LPPQEYFISVSFLFHSYPSTNFIACLEIFHFYFIACPGIFHFYFIPTQLPISLPPQEYFISVSFLFHSYPSTNFIACLEIFHFYFIACPGIFHFYFIPTQLLILLPA